ncbi:LOW QUALITY PROTEIN: testis-expressed protein 2-like [Gastrophryne carolinensis]
MTSVDGSHAEKSRQSSKASTPKVEVQRSVSRETITIRFSALGKEEEEEEEEEIVGEDLDDQNVVTALEAKEDLSFDLTPDLLSSAVTSPTMFATSPPATKPTGNTVIAAEASSPSFSVASDVPSSSSSSSSQQSLDAINSIISGPPEQRPVTVFSPSRGLAQSSSPSISSPKPFLSLVKSLSTEVEPKEPTPPVRHRQIMKSLVKSLSTDTSKHDLDSGAHKPPDSKLNLHLFKQFTQPRITGGDSKTAPSSPITSPSDGRSFFKVTEVEAKIEDTKRRFSEVIYEPFQLLSKIIGDESSSYRPKALSSSASELSSLSGLNGHLENNNNYSIKEEEGDVEAECPDSRGSDQMKEDKAKATAEATSTSKDTIFKSSALVLEKCSLSALASKEDEEFTELYAEDFDFDEENNESRQAEEDEKADTNSEEEGDGYDEGYSIPVKTLYFLVLSVYAYFTLPLPDYACGLCLGIALGFMAAIGILWLFATPRSHRCSRRCHQMHPEALKISEPEILKGWMNEIQNYDPETYHATLTHSVFVRLEGSTLRLSKPNKNISRRAIYNEAKPDVVYVSQKIYDLVDCKVSLVPKGLARKRLWNKKYPICLELAHQEDFMSKAQVDKDSSEEKGDGEKTVSCPEGGKLAVNKEQVLYLFGRSGREKEDWFHHFLLASKIKAETRKAGGAVPMKSGSTDLKKYLPLTMTPTPTFVTPSGISTGLLLTHSRNSSRGSMDEVMSQQRTKELPTSVRQKVLLDYSIYMAQCVPQEGISPEESPLQSANSSPTTAKKTGAEVVAGAEEPQAWVNALLGRIFWDFLGEKYWSDLVSKKIQMKLSKIKLPYFMNELTLTELDMGVSVPKILQAYQPTIDHRGLWTDLEISYNGSFLMTLETKMNLTRLGKEPLGDAFKVGEMGKEGARPRSYYLADSDEESSSAGSSDEEDATEISGDKPLAPGAEGYAGPHRTSKIMRFVDKITKSKYFQKATETEFIKKKMEEVSNTPLLLTVEVQECRGTLAINIPPPPTDRIWYGFRTPPHLELKARPKLGEREVTLAHVTEWIEKKLEQEFQKIFVMPNMDDVYVTVMHSAMDARSCREPEAAADAP